MQKHIENTKRALLRRLPLMIIIYCVMQPILDVIGYWQMMLGLGNALTLGLRMLLLIGSVLLGFLLSDNKKYYYITAAVLLVLTGLHVAANLPGGYTEPVTDLVNLMRIYLMPLTVLCFCTFLQKRGAAAFHAMKKGLILNLLLIALVELISVLTGTDRETYRHEHIGVLGWFYWANSQSAILSMMAPIVICWALHRWPDKLLPVALFAIASEGLLYFFGTRLTFGAMVAGGLGVGVCLFLADRKRWQQALTIFLITALFTAAFPISPMARRMKAVNEINEKNEANISKENIEIIEQETELSTDSEGETVVIRKTTKKPKTSKAWKKLKKVYRSYLPGLVSHFGYTRVINKYDYTTDAAILGDWRIEKLSFCELLMEDSSPMCHCFGLNLLDMREFVPKGVRNEETGVWEDGYINYDVENDFHGVYFLLGSVGLILMVCFLLYFGLLALCSVVKDFRRSFTAEMIGFAGAYVFGMLHAYFTVSVLRRNNASVYMALVLAGLWYLSQARLNGGKPEAAREAQLPAASNSSN